MRRRFLISISVLILFYKQAAIGQVDLSVMTFNIWQEGTSVANGFNKIRDVIVNVNPDIIGFAEVRNYGGQNWTTKMAAELSLNGLNYYAKFAGGDVSLISKYPILDSVLINNQANSIAGFTIEVLGKKIIVIVGHLDYNHYACYLPRGYNGGDPDWNMINDGQGNPLPVKDTNIIAAYNLKSLRDEQMKVFFNYVRDKSDPIIFMGDFNEPSQFDWTANTANLFDHNGVVFSWHTCAALSDSGFTDSYREFFPDEVMNPGITWPSLAHGVGSTSWTPKADERDRIDFIFYKGDSIATSYAALVGPKESYDHNVITTSFTEYENFLADSLLWPSDHKAVLVKLRFQN